MPSKLPKIESSLVYRVEWKYNWPDYPGLDDPYCEYDEYEPAKNFVDFMVESYNRQLIYIKIIEIKTRKHTLLHIRDFQND